MVGRKFKIAKTRRPKVLKALRRPAEMTQAERVCDAIFTRDCFGRWKRIGGAWRMSDEHPGFDGRSCSEGDEFRSGSLNGPAGGPVAVGFAVLPGQVGVPPQRARQSVAVVAEGTDPDAPIALNRPRGELADLLVVSYPRLGLSDLFLGEVELSALRRLVEEQEARELLASHGLDPDRVIVLSGPAGAGKTRAAACLAGELALPLFTVVPPVSAGKGSQPGAGLDPGQVERLADDIGSVRGVYLIDLDRCVTRGEPHERQREIGRLVHQIEVAQTRSGAVGSLVVLSTTRPVGWFGLLASVGVAIDISAPDAVTCRRIVEAVAGRLLPRRVDWIWVIDACVGLTQGQIAAVANDLIKSSLLTGLTESDPVARLVDGLRTRRRLVRQQLQAD